MSIGYFDDRPLLGVEEMWLDAELQKAENRMMAAFSGGFSDKYEMGYHQALLDVMRHTQAISPNIEARILSVAKEAMK